MSCRDCKISFWYRVRPAPRRRKAPPRAAHGQPECWQKRLFLAADLHSGPLVQLPRTTVGFTECTMEYDGWAARLIDAWRHTLDPTNEAEEIAHRILEEGADKVILVIDATALEINLVMALQVLEHPASPRSWRSTWWMRRATAASLSISRSWSWSWVFHRADRGGHWTGHQRADNQARRSSRKPFRP